MRFPRISITISFLGILALLALVFEGCASPLSSGKTGSLSIGLSGNVSRTLVPGINMDAASYTVTGTGPGGAAFTEVSTGASVTKSGLAFGSWTIVVSALNASGTLIGSGSSTAEVITGETATVNVTVRPIEGTGTLSLDVSWSASQVHTPSIAASLTPALGSAQSLAFDVSSGSASFSSSAVGNGYYTLALTLNDNGVAVAGAVEVVRIVAGGTTAGSYAFPNVNAVGGTIQVNINTALQDPLLVNIAGGSPTMSAGSTETLTASAVNYGENVTYVWYVNGLSVATGASYTFGSASVTGYNYRIDVTAFSADGTRAGSATQNVRVIRPSDGSTWTARSLPGGGYWNSVAYGNGIFVAVSYYDGLVATSTDGVNWTTKNIVNAVNWESVMFANGRFIITPRYETITATSIDGISWTLGTVPEDRLWCSAAYGNGIFLMVSGKAEDLEDRVAISSDGITWTQTSLPFFSLWDSVTYGNSRFLAVDYSGNTATSSDGITWTTSQLSGSGWSSATYGNGFFILVNNINGEVAHSYNGSSWTTGNLPINASWSSVTYGNGIFLALATNSNIVATSTTGYDWTLRTLPTSADWQSAAYGNGIFVAVAANGSVATSP